MFVFFRVIDRLNLELIQSLSQTYISRRFPSTSACSSSHQTPPASSPAPPQCMSKRIWVGACMEVCTAFPLSSSGSFITSGMPRLGTDPQRGAVWFFREQETHHGHKLWASAVCAQPCRFAPAPKPRKVLIQGEGRAQAVAEFTTSRLSITLTAQ